MYFNKPQQSRQSFLVETAKSRIRINAKNGNNCLLSPEEVKALAEMFTSNDKKPVSI